ncbi:MAG: GntR family transcriptional regulator [Oscillospiraceae bacterium]
MDFNKLSAPSLKELFVRELETMILSGRLSEGEKLPPERELANTMQVSRAVVNAGIAELTNKGFLSVKPRVGTFVADYRRDGKLETLISIVRYNGGVLRNNEVRSILEMRVALDTLAVEICIPHITDEGIASLRGFVEQMEKTDLPSEVSALAFAFQHELAYLSGNMLIPLIFTSFKELVLGLWMRFCELYGVNALRDNTAELCHCIEKRDIPAAKRHIINTIQESINGDRKIFY